MTGLGTPDTGELMDTKEVSATTGISEATFKWWRQAGVGPTWFKIGHSVKYRRADVETWIDQQYKQTRNGGGLVNVSRPSGRSSTRRAS